MPPPDTDPPTDTDPPAVPHRPTAAEAAGGVRRTPTALEHLRLDADGLPVAALAWGDPAAPVALLLHGYPDTAWTWRHLGPRLAEAGWRAVAPFARGYSPTALAPDDDYSVAALARDALATLAALGSDERAVLVGHDWGAPTAYVAAATAPRRVARVVGMAVPPPGALLDPAEALRDPITLLRQLRMSWYMGFQQIPGAAERVAPRLIERLWRDWSPGYDASEDLAHVASALRGPGRRRAAMRYYREIPRIPDLLDGRGGRYAVEGRHLLDVPRQPTLYLHGADDGCAHPELARRAAPRLAAGGRVEVLDGCGHFLQLERPDAVGDLVVDFLGRG